MVTLDLLIAAGVNPTAAREYHAPLKQALNIEAIQSAKAVACFLANAIVESDGLTRVEENLYYTTPARLCAVFPSAFRTASSAKPYIKNPVKLANLVYANRLGNGDELSGDGWKYRGRGIFQLTGKANYIAYNYPTNPSAVATPFIGALIAAKYFKNNGCVELADKGNYDAVTKVINGPGMLEHKRRKSLTLHILDLIKQQSA